MKTILVTGSAGFIGFHVSKTLLKEGYNVIGVDNLNEYYDVKLKKDRLNILKKHDHFRFAFIDISKKKSVKKVFEMFDISIVINLAAQAGVRYSVSHPKAYIDSNLVGFANIIEECKNYKIEHLVFASSSSVYGINTNYPFSEHDNTDHPASLYAATKKSNELIAHAYSYTYGLPVTGLRLFTVYGPWGRPDMAVYHFTDSIIKNKVIKVYNYGYMERDFTYIDDIVEGIIQIMDKPPEGLKEFYKQQNNPSVSCARYRIYNLGNSKPIKLMDLIELLEKKLNKKSKIKYYPIHAGDIQKTYADVDDLFDAVQFKPEVTIEEGLDRFIQWYYKYYNISLQ
ncbi:SDR family NAD(P)-dependent oxidoreductase [Abyssisolibacter fermentans]|uniref:SDR family NAD(P)-dependent oxidoreductase n=1 Tax=Abyssisolibacter fermentans TaxID=1766203 RepID=UPI00082DE25E|nr:SDR family NAD(P)-dependent oxidoreductase [Abyssisolibacter fermentans]